MRFISILIISLLVGCASNVAQFVPVTYGEREALHFTGRGAAAGIMMDAYMGGAGVAIGIAIDEGIAKDISAALLANNPKFSMASLVNNVLSEQGKKGVSVAGLKSVVIDKYGFQSAPDDKVSPLLEMQFVCNSGVLQKVKLIPDENVASITFEQSKTDGALVEKQLRAAVDVLIDKNSRICSEH